MEGATVSAPIGSEEWFRATPLAGFRGVLHACLQLLVAEEISTKKCLELVGAAISGDTAILAYAPWDALVWGGEVSDRGQGEKIGQLEAALATALIAQRTAEDKRDAALERRDHWCTKLEEKDAALAAAHEALQAIVDHDDRCVDFGLREKASKALSAPALARAAEKLRLLRAWEAAALDLDRVIDRVVGDTESSVAIGAAERECKVAWTALRAHRERA
jgi:hypothetical protein